jgi:hypothetical protein
MLVFIIAILYPTNLNAKTHETSAFELLDTPAVSKWQNIPTKAKGKILRNRTTSVHLDVLSNLSDAGDEIITLNLFDDVTLDCVLNRRIKRSPSSYTGFGRILGKDRATFSLAVKEDTMIANVRLPGEAFYQIRYLSEGLHEVLEIDPNKIPDCNGVLHVPEQDLQPDLMREYIIQAKDPPVAMDNVDCGIDILVLYTPAAREAAGGTTAMQAVINLAVDESNIAYSNSEIDMLLRLVHTAEANYTESGSSATDLERLTYIDGYMDSVHNLRDTYGADLVSLLIHYPGSGGRGWLWENPEEDFSDYAFHVVPWDNATGYYSFAHEIGHNMGCQHATPEAAQGDGMYNYSMGWRFASDAYRTIMAYAPGTRIQHFSNPNVTYLGYQTGVPLGQPDEAHNALTINNVASIIANWRMHTIPYTTKPGDFEPDCDVDWIDLSFLCSQWLSTDCNLDNNFCGGADFEPDGDVDIEDFAYFAENWGTSILP